MEGLRPSLTERVREAIQQNIKVQHAVQDKLQKLVEAPLVNLQPLVNEIEDALVRDVQRSPGQKQYPVSWRNLIAGKEWVHRHKEVEMQVEEAQRCGVKDASTWKAKWEDFFYCAVVNMINCGPDVEVLEKQYFHMVIFSVK